MVKWAMIGLMTHGSRRHLAAGHGSPPPRPQSDPFPNTFLETSMAASPNSEAAIVLLTGNSTCLRYRESRVDHPVQ